jgi:Zn/Cd-binding protein ZinT
VTQISGAPRFRNNHRFHEDLRMNTLLFEIKNWNTKYVNKLEKNNANTLAVNPLDTSATTYKLKRYTIKLYQTDLSKTPIQELK